MGLFISIQTGLFKSFVRLGRGRKVLTLLLAYILTIISIKNAIQVSIEQKFYTLSI